MDCKRILKILEKFQIVLKVQVIFLKNFCEDKLHNWHRPNKDCSRLPRIIIIGPQKTGTTALHEFLKVHPNLRTNKPTIRYEETQFFKYEYLKGLDW